MSTTASEHTSNQSVARGSRTRSRIQPATQPATPTTAPAPAPLARVVQLPDRSNSASWWDLAACSSSNWPVISPDTNHDPEVFYPKRLEGGQCAPAKALCVGCPVRVSCLTEGLREPLGIWGGLSEKERRTAQKMAKKGMDISQILAWFDHQLPKRRRKTTVTTARVLEAASLTGAVIDQFLAITGTVPTGAGDEQGISSSASASTTSLEPSSEVLREQRRRRNGLR